MDQNSARFFQMNKLKLQDYRHNFLLFRQIRQLDDPSRPSRPALMAARRSIFRKLSAKLRHEKLIV